MNRMNQSNLSILEKIVSRAHYTATQMIFQANYRDNIEKGDPKIGGHPSASASTLHLLGALHLRVKKAGDFIANKPHAAPMDHAYNYLLEMLFKENGQALSQEEAHRAMLQLRAFPTSENPHVFQSYHSDYDPDHYRFVPSGTVGIPPVVIGYLALAHRFAQRQGYLTHGPVSGEEPHFWAICGDSEFHEGSLHEAIPDLAERELGNVCWILDYNRQSLDGHRIANEKKIWRKGLHPHS